MEITIGKNYFITGAGGTGKSHLVRQIIQKHPSIVLAPTGIAAANVEGQTIHSFFKFGISNNIDQLKLHDQDQFKKYSKYGKRRDQYLKPYETSLRCVKILVIDEISMVSDSLFEMINYRLESDPFLKITLIVVGDLYQLPPVDGDYAFRSEKWAKYNFQKIELTKVMRTTDSDFINIQHEIRYGNCSEKTVEFLKNCKCEGTDLTLYSTNAEVRIDNEKHLSEINSELITIPTDYTITNDFLRDSIINSFSNDYKIDREFKFKIGAKAMCIINSKDTGLYNGKTGRIVGFENDKIIFASGENHWVIPKHSFEKIEYNANGQKTVLGVAKQFPLVIAAAITIHKSQGMSIDSLTVDFSRFFAKGQAYVAISRATNTKKLNLINFDPKYIAADKTINI